MLCCACMFLWHSLNCIDSISKLHIACMGYLLNMAELTKYSKFDHTSLSLLLAVNRKKKAKAKCATYLF